MKKRVLIVFPTSWDERQLAALEPATRARYEFHFDEPRDADVRWDLDVVAHIAARARDWQGRLDGVLSSSDYPGAIAAAALARALDLPGAPPESVLCASHKYYSRLVQREVAPEAVPEFALLDLDDPATWPDAARFPRFVKPVKGSFSLFARAIADAGALARFAGSPALTEFRAYYVRLFDALARRYARFEHGAHLFLAEELLSGAQVTVEGWVHAGEAHVLGVVDTSFHPGTQSFSRFDYPSHLAPDVQRRMGDIACRVALAHGLAETLFNVELFYDMARDRIGIIELNPRLCGQFGDLYQKVDGTNGFELALALACGEEPRVARGAGRFRAAASIPLRVFHSVDVRRAPDPAEVRALEERHPGSLVWSECRTGERLLVDGDVEDGSSLRYGVLNLGGRDRAHLAEQRAAIVEALSFDFVPVPAEPAPLRAPRQSRVLGTARPPSG